ncbi:MAG: phosphoribosylglycinamide formyltransferase [Mucinivorans sp.]
MKHIAIFASGAGTNAQAIIDFFEDSKRGQVSALLSNRPQAYALERARKKNIDTLIFNRDTLYNSTDTILDFLEQKSTDLVVLAGFMMLVPQAIIDKYRGRIINIHPALLPAYGGKGMYGDHVHEAVVAAHESFSGITIHYVNENYDSGDIIFQAKVALKAQESPESLAQKIHKLEHEYFPQIINQLL